MSAEPVPSRVAAARPAYAVAVLIVAYAAFGTMLEPGTLPSALAVLIPAGAVGAVSLYRNRPVRPLDADVAGAPLRRSVRLWSVVIIAGLLWEAWAFFHQPAWDAANHDYPTLSVLVAPVLEHDAVIFAAWAAWLYAGYRLVRL